MRSYTDDLLATYDPPSIDSNIDDLAMPNKDLLKQLAQLLAAWREMLPSDLQWSDGDITAFPAIQRPTTSLQMLDQSTNLEFSILLRFQGAVLFTTDCKKALVPYPFDYDIHVALLRTRYLYEKYMLYRPFVYKALHFPDRMDKLDKEKAAQCLQVSFSSSYKIHFRPRR